MWLTKNTPQLLDETRLGFPSRNGVISVNEGEKVTHFCQNSDQTFSPHRFPGERKVRTADGDG